MVFLLVRSFGQSAKETKPRPYNIQEAYEVYAAALTLDHGKGELLIADTTLPFNQCLDSRSDKLADAAINNYKDTNKVRWLLRPQLKLNRPYRLLAETEIKRLQQKDPESGFLWRFPPGVAVIHFSAVGFSADKTIAFVEMDVTCGGLCGHGAPFILQKRDGKWSEYSPPWTRNPDGTMRGPAFCMWNY